MKKIFALATALVSMTAALTSCGNGEADYVMNPAPSPVVTSTNSTTQTGSSHTKTLSQDVNYNAITFYIPFVDGQLDHFDYQFTVEGKFGTETFNAADLYDAGFVPAAAKLKDQTNVFYKAFMLKADLKSHDKLTVTANVIAKTPYADIEQAKIAQGFTLVAEAGQQSDTKQTTYLDVAQFTNRSSLEIDAIMTKLAKMQSQYDSATFYLK